MRYYRICFHLPETIRNEADIASRLTGTCSFPGVFGNGSEGQRKGTVAKVYVDWDARLLYATWQRNPKVPWLVRMPNDWALRSTVWGKADDEAELVLTPEQVADMKTMEDLTRVA